MDAVHRLGYYTPRGGIGKIIENNGKYTATIAQLEKGVITVNIKILARQAFDNMNEASAWILKNGYKSIQSEDHQRQLGLDKHRNWFTVL